VKIQHMPDMPAFSYLAGQAARLSKTRNLFNFRS